MVGRNVFRCCLVVVALFGGRSAAAAPITFTGNVASDFNPATNSSVTIITNSMDQNPISTTGPNSTPLLNGLAPGISLKQVAVDYNAATDTMYVGVQTWGVAGSVAGTTLGSGNGMAVGFAPLIGTYNPSDLSPPAFVAGVSNVASGVSAAAAGRGTGLDGFNVTSYTGGTAPGTMNLLTGFGQTLTAGTGSLAFTPSTATPGFEFAITNFSKLLGANPANGVVVMTQDGQVNVNSGKGELVGVYPTQQAQQLPEPTALLVWAGLAGGLAWGGYRRRSRRSAS